MAGKTIIRKGWCGPCHTRCGLLVHFEGDRAVKVEGDPKHPVNKGAICPRGRLILEHLYHPDRVNYPLKRSGGRGQGMWQRITWEQALDEIAAKLSAIKKESGPEALAFSMGTYRTYQWATKRFYNLFGSPNITGASQICMCPTHSVEWSTYGYMAKGDIPNANCIVVWGYQPSNSYPVPIWPQLVAAKKRGAKFITVDPRRTKEAELADIWLQVRPGTDVALMLGWLKVIIDENLYDRRFVEKWTAGFEQLKQRVQEYPLKRVAEITWVPEEKIVAAARIYATTKPAVFTWGLGVDLQGVNATQGARARCILRAITSNLDIKGGELLGITAEDRKTISDVEMELNELLPPAQKAKQLGADEYRLFGHHGYDLITRISKDSNVPYVRPPKAYMTCNAHPRHVWDAILTGKPYPVKALIVQANNALVQAADTRLVHRALTSPNLELMVVMDYYLTPTAELADYVMPVAGTLERSDFPASPKALEPLYERRDDYQFWRELGLRLGQEKYWPWKTAEEMCDYRLKPLGITFEEAVKRVGLRTAEDYRKYEKYGFSTPSGKVEIYSSIFESLKLDPLPHYIEPPETPINNKLAKDFPLILIATGKFLPMYHAELRQIPSALKQHPDPLTDVHPETARKLGIAHGDWIWIETVRGKIRQRARVTDEVHPSMVRAQHGWWFPKMPGEEPSLHGLWESNVNALCPVDREFCNVEVGGWPHTGLLCRVYKAD